MKKLFIFLFIMGLAVAGFSQTGCPNCVINTGFITSDGLPGINLTTLPPACVGQPYSQDVTVYLPGTFAYQGMTVNLRNIVITSVTGVPTGISWEKNGGGTTWTVNGTTTRGCFRLCGTPTVAGSFSIGLNITVNVTVFSIPQAQNQSYTIPMTVLALPVQVGPITGSPTVTPGQTGVTYSVTPDPNATSYTWSYTGTGATINGTGSSITIDFTPSATAGALSVIAHNSCGDGPVSANYDITIGSNPVPGAAGSITGTDSVCPGTSHVLYYVAPITNADSNIWNYTGTGVTIIGSNDSVYLYFSASATSGDLTVRGHNVNGDGAASPVFAIVVNQMPEAAGAINGPAHLCYSHNGDYIVPAINNASSYVWDYTGAGETITGNGNSVIVHFDSLATSGDIVVYGHNICGNGIPATFPVIISQVLNAPLAIIGSDTICAGDTGIVFSIARVANAASYLWSYDGTGATITGTDTSIRIGFLSSATSGNLSVVAQDSCGNSPVSPLHSITIEDCNVGIADRNAFGELQIVPNPGNGVFTVSLQSNTNLSCNGFILNSVGQKVASYSVKLHSGQNIFKIDLTNYPEGIYYLRLASNSGSVSNVIIVSR